MEKEVGQVESTEQYIMLTSTYIIITINVNGLTVKRKTKILGSIQKNRKLVTYLQCGFILHLKNKDIKRP